MERFFAGVDGEPEIAVYRADPKWKRIYRFLRRGFWHVTSPEAWYAIRKSGAIKPNIAGRFPVAWEQTVCSFGYNHGYIAIFDFLTPTEEEVIRSWQHAWDVITHLKSQPTVLLQLDRRRLRRKIISNNHGFPPKDGEGATSGCIPWLEVWYPEDIPIGVISGVFRIPPGTVFGELNPEKISKTATVQPERQRDQPARPLSQFEQVLAELLERRPDEHGGVDEIERRIADVGRQAIQKP